MDYKFKILLFSIFIGTFVECAPEFDREEFDAELRDLENDFLKDLEELRREELEDIERFRNEVSSEEFAQLPESYLLPKLKEYDITQETPKSDQEPEKNEEQDYEQATEEDQPISYEVLISSWRGRANPDANQNTEQPEDDGQTDSPEEVQESNETREDSGNREVDDEQTIDQSREVDQYSDTDQERYSEPREEEEPDRAESTYQEDQDAGQNNDGYVTETDNQEDHTDRSGIADQE